MKEDSLYNMNDEEESPVRRYYSIRTGRHPLGSKLDFPLLIKLFQHLWGNFEGKGYFQEAFGYSCVDAGDVSGKITNIEAYFLLKLRKDNLWPIYKNCLSYDESDLFDVIELLYDLVSKPIDGTYHSWGNCGWHYSTFDKISGQKEFRIGINELLQDYQTGYGLSSNGEILIMAIPGTEMLLGDTIPSYDEKNVDNIVKEAISCYRRSRSSTTDKRNAVKMLADVLEFLRPKIDAVLTTADEKDLFNIANNFGIRHHNDKQKSDYDQDVWLDWMFYYYLATIESIIRLVKKSDNNA